MNTEPVRHLLPKDYKRVPWKNGLGFTDILGTCPQPTSEDPGAFLWRISRAAVDLDGPFSCYPGIDRTIVALQGAGMELEHGLAAPKHTLLPLMPYRFSGDWPTLGNLLSGPVIDFNVMTLRGAAVAEVQVLSLPPNTILKQPMNDALFVYVVGGSIEARTNHDQVLACARAGESLFVPESCAIDELTLTAQ
jgi:environmental stress-induced protein Ves